MVGNRHLRRKTARERYLAPVVTRSSAHRWFFVLISLIALAIQILVVQPHIHTSRMAVGALSTGLAAVEVPGGAATKDQSPSTPRDKLPINDDPANCPLCQVITLTSHYISAAVILIIAPAERGVAFAIEVASPVFYHTHSHSWRGRAPPAP